MQQRNVCHNTVDIVASGYTTPGRRVSTGADPVGAIWAIASLKPTKVTLFTMILHNSENSIRDIRPFCRPFFVTAVL